MCIHLHLSLSLYLSLSLCVCVYIYIYTHISRLRDTVWLETRPPGLPGPRWACGSNLCTQSMHAFYATCKELVTHRQTYHVH